MNREETGRLVEAASGIQPRPTVVDTVYTHTDGNPYFMTELVRLLVSQGGMEDAGAMSAQGLRIPEGVREVIGQRLNRLSESCNRVLTTASIIGREFNLDQLVPLHEEMSEDQLLEGLEEALEARLIEEFPQTVGRYQFAHRLAQETLIQELSLTRKVRLHARIATALEELYASSTNTHAAELAYHFAQGETVTGTDKLVEYSLVAGEQALGAYAYEEALVLFQRALDSKHGETDSANPVTVTDGDTAALHFGLARAQLATFGRRMFREPYQNLRRSFDYYVETGDVDMALAVAEHPVTRGIHYDVGRHNLLSAALLLVSPDSLHAGLLLAEYGSALYHEIGDRNGAQEAFARSLAVAEMEQDRELEMRTLAYSAEVDLWTFNWEQVPSKGQRAIELAKDLDNPTFQVTASYITSRALAGLGRLQEAQQLAESMIVPAKNSRSIMPLFDALWSNGTLCRSSGDWQDARRFLTSDSMDSLDITRPRTDLAVINHQLGDLVEGEANVKILLENPPAGVT
jgi:tetratricopeptide (TPR) repeat protein